MPALLRQLQKHRGNHAVAIDDVLIRPQSGRTSAAEVSVLGERPELIEHIQEQTTDSSRLLSELVAESASLHGAQPELGTAVLSSDSIILARPEGVDSQVLRVVRKRSESATSIVESELRKQPESAAAWWLSEPKKQSPLVEMLVNAARKQLSTVLLREQQLPNERQEWEGAVSDHVRRAVELAAQAVRSEFRSSRRDLEQAERELLAITTGKGPLQPLFDDPRVTEIYIDSHRSIKAIRYGQVVDTPFVFRNSEEYRLFVDCLLWCSGERLSADRPIVDVVLNDSWRCHVNVIDTTISNGGEPRVCFRIPRLQAVTFYDLLQLKAVPSTVAAWLADAVGCGELNMLISGGFRSGRTLMTTALLSSVTSEERVVTIEEMPEISATTVHLEKILATPVRRGKGENNGEAEVSVAQLVSAALRRAPHRIVVGELCGAETAVFVKALERGLSGSMATIFADTPDDALWRMCDLLLGGGDTQGRQPDPVQAMRRICRTVHLIVQMKRVDGTPCLSEIAEVVPNHLGEVRVGEVRTVPLLQYAGIFDGRRRWRVCAQSSRVLELLRERGVVLKPGAGVLPAGV